MFFDLCLRVWSFLGQTPAGDVASPVVNTTVTNSAAPASFFGNMTWFGFLRWILMAAYLMVCGSLIYIIMMKHTKSDGLTGLAGAGSANQNSYHGKRSAEENMSMAANYLAGSFIVLSIVISLVMH